MFKSLKLYLKKLGPGLITGASDDDPSGIVTYSQAGSQFGLTTLWTAFLTFPLMVGIQEMCARLGLVTGKGLAQNIKEFYPKIFLYITVGLTVPAIIFNIGANVASMGAVANLIAPQLPANLYSALFTLILMALIIFVSYEKMVKILKYLCLSLILYIIIPFLNPEP